MEPSWCPCPDLRMAGPPRVIAHTSPAGNYRLREHTSFSRESSGKQQALKFTGPSCPSCLPISCSAPRTITLAPWGRLGRPPRTSQFHLTLSSTGRDQVKACRSDTSDTRIT